MTRQNMALLTIFVNKIWHFTKMGCPKASKKMPLIETKTRILFIFQWVVL